MVRIEVPPDYGKFSLLINISAKFHLSDVIRLAIERIEKLSAAYSFHIGGMCSVIVNRTKDIFLEGMINFDFLEIQN